MSTKSTSHNVASLASKVLTTPSSSATAKQLAGSALSQVVKNNATGAKMEHLASKVLESPKYSEQTKTLAGSVLSQSLKGRR
jgi:hypothetical protein